jgi:hypothetical protein
MRYLTEYLHSSNHQTATLSSDDAADVKLSPSAETQKDMDQVPFPDEPDPEGGASCSAQYSGPTGVDREQTENFSVRMESAVRIARDKHREGYSSAAGVAETNGAIRGIFLTEIDPSAEQPSVDTDIAELVTLMKRFALLSGDADLRPRVIGEAVSDSDNRLSADRSEVRVSLEAATPNNQLGHVVHDRMVAGSADGQGEPPRKTLSASYYRRRAEVLRIALITTRRPEAAVRLRAFIEKYRALAEQAARYTHPSEGI